MLFRSDLLNAVIESGKPVKAKRFSGGWIEFDTNEDYERAVEWADSGELDKFIRLNPEEV